MTTVWTIIGMIAAILASFGFVPQVKKMWERRSVGDVSIGTFIQFSAGVILWVVYGLSRADAVVVIANIVTFITLSAGLFLYYKFRQPKAQGVIHQTIRGAQDIGANPMVAVRESTRGLIVAAAEAGGDIGAVARAALEEALDGAKAKDILFDEKAVASAVYAGALKAADKVGNGAVESIQQSVSDIVDTVGLEKKEETLGQSAG